VNIKKIGLALLAVLMIGLLLVSVAGCGVPAEVQEELTQLRQERQEWEAEKQQAAEEERIAQIVEKRVQEALAKAAEEDKLEERLSSIESQLAKLSSELEKPSTTHPGWQYYPSPPPYCWPPQPSPTPYPAAYFRAEVYRGQNLDTAQYVGYFDESSVEHDWGYSGPCGLTDDFSVRWEGQIWFEAGRYRFTVDVDDGAKLWTDGKLKINQWSSQGLSTHDLYLDISRGYHSIKLEYRERSGKAFIELSWERIDDDC